MAKKVTPGVDDLATHFPEIAKEAAGWDPSTVFPNSAKKLPWVCPEEGHIYEATVANRTRLGARCAYCYGRTVLTGFNDVKTCHPGIAKEADGWDPSTVHKGSNSKFDWKCDKGHTWKTAVTHRAFGGTGCPYCANKKVWPGFNDMQTVCPEVAKEAYEFDPSDVLATTHKKLRWKCPIGHIYEALPSNRIQRGQGCPYCAGNRLLSGFNDLKTRFPEIAVEAWG